MDFAINMFLVVKRKVVYNVSSVFHIVKVLLYISSYFVFNISYPNLLGGLFVFMFYAYKIKPKEKIPISVCVAEIGYVFARYKFFLHIASCL